MLFLLAQCSAPAQVATYTPPAAGTFNPLTTAVGQSAGVPNQPWQQSPNMGPNLWLTPITNVGGLNTNVTSPITLTGNSTVQTSQTVFNLNNGGSQNGDYCYRLTFDVSTSGNTGWAALSYRWTDPSGNAVAGQSEQPLVSNPSGSVSLTHFKSFVELKQPAGAAGLSVYVRTFNNFTAGETFTLNTATLYRIAQVKPALNVAWTGGPSSVPDQSGGYCIVDIPLVDPVTRQQSLVRESNTQDSDLLFAIGGGTWYPPGVSYQFNFLSGTANVNTGPPLTTLAGTSGQQIINGANFGLVLSAVRANGASEVRCNTHGGEWGASSVVTTLTSPATAGQNTITTAAALAVGTPLVVGPVSTAAGEIGKTVTAVSGAGPYTETLSGNLTGSYAVGIVVAGLTGTFGSDWSFAFDMGDGTWNTLSDVGFEHQCRRFRMICSTVIVRSDQSAPFASVTYAWTYYADGTLRCDRTITMLQSQAFTDFFAWMCAYPPSGAGNFTAQGRIGTGQSVLGRCDYRSFLAAPVIASVTTAGTGGTLPAAAKAYRLTSLTAQGETLASAPVSVTSTGTTSSNTITFPSPQAGQTTWRIYDATGLLATVPVAATLYVDTGAIGGAGQPPTIAGAWVTGANTLYDSAASTLTDWAVYRESTGGCCFWMGLDRDAILAAVPGATAVKGRLLNASGITKTYFDLVSGNTSGPLAQTNSAADPGFYQYTLPSGLVIKTTTFAGWYLPADPLNFEKEVGGRPIKSLPTLYPTN